MEKTKWNATDDWWADIKYSGLLVYVLRLIDFLGRSVDFSRLDFRIRVQVTHWKNKTILYGLFSSFTKNNARQTFIFSLRSVLRGTCSCDWWRRNPFSRGTPSKRTRRFYTAPSSTAVGARYYYYGCSETDRLSCYVYSIDSLGNAIPAGHETISSPYDISYPIRCSINYTSALVCTAVAVWMIRTRVYITRFDWYDVVLILDAVSGRLAWSVHRTWERRTFD